jgi:hypothetical protein
MCVLAFYDMVIPNTPVIYALGCVGSTWVANAFSTAPRRTRG